jgi:hypothetical protein
MANTTVKTKSNGRVVTKGVEEAYGDQRFFVINGQVCSRLNELSAALKSMDSDTYNYHVNGDKNDFSEWVSAVMLNKPLAAKIAKAKSKNEMATIIEKNN